MEEANTSSKQRWLRVWKWIEYIDIWTTKARTRRQESSVTRGPVWNPQKKRKTRCLCTELLVVTGTHDAIDQQRVSSVAPRESPARMQWYGISNPATREMH
ncbi:hypothetical protein PRK78_000184 [Emydomyces testavorans]|uniref:Uncharacterized protein n=1 Tax=Emydomyces testavorans TaxID=2070801 RepID=A0AAF0DA75_9EURO|nr:hypothetical protein PRK78_000184 [Emydomyces testavorans]